ncbi:MAG: hypothetical protein MIO93_08440 [ANME-2 cluster archaeon]|nr:hypothetical protein [ANME-2 cluster archaeon]
MKNFKIISFYLRVIGFSILFSGCIGEKPESVLEKEVKYLENGDYEKLWDQFLLGHSIHSQTIRNIF